MKSTASEPGLKEVSYRLVSSILRKVPLMRGLGSAVLNFRLRQNVAFSVV